MAHEWYPWYPALYRAKTMHLTAEQDGIYRRLIDHYMETRQPLPDNDAALARIAGVSGDTWAIAAAIIRPFFTDQNTGRLHIDRCDSELQRQDGINRKQSEKGKKGAEKRWNKNKSAQDVNSSGHDSAKAQPLLGDATLHNTTLHNTTEKNNSEAKASSSPAQPKIDFDFTQSRWIGITQEMTHRWAKAYPACDITRQLNAAAAWLFANPKKAKKNYAAFINNWLTKAQERGGDIQANTFKRQTMSIHQGAKTV